MKVMVVIYFLCTCNTFLSLESFTRLLFKPSSTKNNYYPAVRLPNSLLYYFSVTGIISDV